MYKTARIHQAIQLHPSENLSAPLETNIEQSDKKSSEITSKVQKPVVKAIVQIAPVPNTNENQVENS